MAYLVLRRPTVAGRILAWRSINGPHATEEDAKAALKALKQKDKDTPGVQYRIVLEVK